jgi:hypothetical protein
MPAAAIANAQSPVENIAMATMCAAAQTIVPASPKLRFPCGLHDAVDFRGNEAWRSQVIRQVDIPLPAAALRDAPPMPMHTRTNNKRRS